MSMINRFKWSHFKKNLKEKLIRFFSNVYPKENEKKFILINSMDALGDNLIKTKTIEKIAEFYGKENIYILCKFKWASIYEKLGYNVVIDYYKGFFKRIGTYRKINSLPLKKVIYFIHDGELVSEDLINCKEKEVFEGIKEDKYILEYHREFLKKILNKDYSLEELRPNLKKYYKDNDIKNIISIGIGASNIKRTLPVEKMMDIIKLLMNIFPEKKIVLLGSGKKQYEYAEKIEKSLNCDRIENLVDKIDLDKVLSYVASSDLFIGYDSGLTNAAFTFRTKYICLHWSKIKVWIHNFENCITLIGDGNIEVTGNYGTKYLNSIKLEDIEKALLEG